LFDRPDAIVLVEWPERDPELGARSSMAVTLSIPPDGIGRIAEIVR
jgi:tRNA A37 threonylcarbamoyladenosine biosynthesis protein TsaE